MGVTRRALLSAIPIAAVPLPVMPATKEQELHRLVEQVLAALGDEHGIFFVISDGAGRMGRVMLGKGNSRRRVFDVELPA